MAKLAGTYRIKARPTLPEVEISESLNFVISTQGYSLGFTSIRVDSTGIYYFLATVNSAAEEEPEYVQVYNAELGVWVASYSRTFSVEKEQTVSSELDKWISANRWQLPAGRETISFSVNGTELIAIKGTSWFVWLQSVLADSRISYTPDDLVTYNDRIISRGEEDVNLYDFIESGAEYSIKPQVNVNIRITGRAEMNPLFAKRNSEGAVLYANRTYETSIVCDDNYYAIPQARMRLNGYVEYEVMPDGMIIYVGDIPSSFMEQDTLEVTVQIARKIYDKLTDSEVVLESGKGTITQLAPQYKVNIDGSYYLSSSGEAVKKTPTAYDGRPVYGLVLPLSTLGQYVGTVSDGEALDGLQSLSIFFAFSGIDPSRILLGKRIYAMDSWFVEHMNQELSVEDIIGEPIMLLDYDEDEIIGYCIEAMANDAGVSVDTFIVGLENAAGAPVGSDPYKSYVISLIEKEFGDIELLRYVTSTTVTEEIAEAIRYGLRAYKTNLYDSYMSYSSYSMSMLIWYAASEIDGKGVKNAFSYSPSREVLYPLYNGDIQITTDFAVSDANDFNLTSDGNKLNGSYLKVEKYDPPVDRYTPGTLTVSRQTCLAGDTIIEMADGTFKRIDALLTGELVRTVSGAERVIFTDAMANKERDSYTEYYFSDGSVLRVIKDHRVYVPRRDRYVHISTLKIGDEILKRDGRRVQLINKLTLTARIRHYTLFTENCNGYFANGILCGNIFSNIRIGWMRRILLKLYYNIVLRKELRRYEKH